MNGGQDLGGMMGFGPIGAEADEPVFHAPWERRAFALSVAMGMIGSWTIDMTRHARESVPPGTYWSSSYYRTWLVGLERLLTERGLASAGEIAAGRLLHAPRQGPRKAMAGEIAEILAEGSPAARPPRAPARFGAGDRIRTRELHPAGHTRLPRYLRGQPGTVERVHGCHVFPDSSAHGRGDDPRWLYAVRFAARDLWGRRGDDSIVADLFEPYLEAAA